MVRIFLLTLILGALMICSGLVILGTFPPSPSVHQVAKDIPIGSLKTPPSAGGADATEGGTRRATAG